MNKRALTVLEYDKITARLAEHASSEPGRKMCEALLPCAYETDAERALQETADALKRIGVKGGISFGSNFDSAALRQSLAIGATLEMRQLLRVASFLENTERVRTYGVRPTDKDDGASDDSLSDYFRALEPLKDISSEIRRCILSEDEMADEASPALKQIRRQLAQSSERVRETLNKMVNGSMRGYLQDAVVTMRGDRYCLPVRAEHKGNVNGIVHDRSSSGSTLFIEPAAVVELNNKIRELALQEEKEIARILAEISASLTDRIDALTDNATYMTLLDFIFAKALYAQELDAVKPAFTKDRGFWLLQARHPLIGKDQVVATDICLGENLPWERAPYRMLIITGPNTGGKTVTLKTTGLLMLMGMSGLMIPADEKSRIAFYREIYADIGDEQSIEQSLSTFSSHMTNIVRILQEAGSEDLCLFDELGAGTDPTEGAALAISILSDLLNRDAAVLATTHYAELKVFAMTTERVVNASCEFDIETLRPTYRLLIGTPGMSNAFAISRKLGLPEEIIDGAHAQIDTDKARMETLFADLETSRKTIEAERERIEQYKQETQALNAKLEEQSREFDSLGEDILADAHEEAERILTEAKRFADDTIRLMRKSGADEELLAVMERERTKLNERIGAQRSSGKKAKEKAAPPQEGERLTKEQAKKGERVHIVSMGLTGIIESLPDKDENVYVRCGVMQVKAKVSDLSPAPEKEESAQEIAKKFSMKQAFAAKESGGGKGGGKRHSVLNDEYVSAEINLIGKNTDDALHALDKYLDNAYRAHLPSVRIVHGKGTGTLRNAVRTHLKSVRYIKKFQEGEYGEGDAGVTVATFK
ncbi:MAG: endonuclease MutS2 [Lachnospiraceae bacterium]|nr:endonuclease MutS2 [Lachnospiraceae bacterium]